jgi:hypothetical protein
LRNNNRKLIYTHRVDGKYGFGLIWLGMYVKEFVVGCAHEFVYCVYVCVWEKVAWLVGMWKAVPES